MATRRDAAPRQVPLRTVRELGALIRDARAQRRWTQAELAERAKVGRQWLVSVESGRHSRAEVGRLLRVLHALGMELFVRTLPAAEPSLERPAGPPTPDVDLGSLLSSLTGEEKTGDG